MSVHREERAGGHVFKVRWRHGGRQRAETFDNESDARDFDAKVRLARRSGALAELDAGKITLAEYADLWWQRYAEPNLAQGTLEAYAIQLDNRILRAFGGWQLRELTPAAIEEWASTQRRKGVGDPTMLKALGLLQGILKRAVIDGHIARNPVREVTKPRQQRTREPLLLTPERVEAIRGWLLANTKRRRREDRLLDATLVSLLAYAGPRPESEGITLTWPQIRQRTIVFRASKHHGRPRTTRLLAPLAQDLAELRLASGRPSSGLVFPRKDGGAWSGEDWDNWRDRIFREACEAVGLPWETRPRDLRGSFASLLIWEGCSVVEVARQIGNSSATCLRNYASVFEEFDPADRRPAEQVIRQAREKTLPLFPASSRSAGGASA